MATVNFVQARKICTPEELRVVEATRRETLTQWGVADLKKQITLARRLRNKWRDLSTSQRRRSQAAQNARVTDENRRSQQKAELFDEVLGRLEKQLAHLAAAPKDAPVKQSAASNPPKQARAAEHRSQRAEVRKKLEEKRVRLTKAKRPASRGKNAPTDASPDVSAADQPAVQTPDKPARAPAKKASSAAKKQPARKKPAGTSPASKPLGGKTPPAQAQPNLGAAASKGTQQVRVKAAAKKARVQASGLTTRTRGHVSARGKRSQSRRDARN